MSCDAIFAPFATFINDAYRLAGRSGQQILNGGDINLATRILNNLLAEWSARDSLIFFNNVVSFTAPGNVENFIFTVRENFLLPPFLTDMFVVNTMPMNNIYSGYYETSQLHYPMKYLEQKSYDSIVFRDFTTWPSYFTYQAYKDYTLVRIFAKPPEGFIITFHGKQKISAVTLFQSDTGDIPDYAFLFLQYELAKELVNFTGSMPQPTFWSEYKQHKRNFVSANRQDEQYEITQLYRPAMTSFSSAPGINFGNNGGASGGSY